MSGSEPNGSAAPKITFACVSCGHANEVIPSAKELLFGGTGASGGARPLSSGPKERTFIVRCGKCKHDNRVRVEIGAP